MELQRGQVVRSLSGHDKGGFQVILEVQGGYLVLCDGKRRTLMKPKKKKPIHVAATKHVLSDDALVTDRSIREALKRWNNA